MHTKICVHACGYIYPHVGVSLLVPTIKAMRRPQQVGRAKARIPRFRFNRSYHSVTPTLRCRDSVGPHTDAMAKNANLKAAKEAQNDEFYTQYDDIQKEINAYLEYNPDLFRGKTILLPCDDPEWSNFTKFFAQNFEFFGLRRLISTSFAQASKNFKTDWQPTLFETQNPLYDADRSEVCGKIFILDRDTNGDSRINIHDLEWQYLKGTGDFRSDEVTRLRDEVDMIITNPPFSLFREFMDWLVESGKPFAVIGNVNALKYRNIFPLIQTNRLWLGATGVQPKIFLTPSGAPHKMGNTCWYTNIEHGRRHQPLSLLSMDENIKYSKHPLIRIRGYLRYDNYDAIDVPYTDAIPSDYNGIMGVPISFLDKYCPEQFEILGMTDRDSKYITRRYTRENYPNYSDLNRCGAILINDKLQVTYTRLLIRKRKQQ